MKYFFITLIALSALACNKPKTNDSVKAGTINGREVSQEELDAIEATMDSLINAEDYWTWPDSVKNILRMPDSIMNNDSIMSDPNLDITKYYTPEQKALSRAIMEIYVENLDLKDGHVIINISREEFINKGIPEVYYDDLTQSIKGMNVMNRAYKIPPEKIAADWEIMKNELKKQLAGNPE